MARAKLQQIELTSGDSAAQPPFPGGWALAIFEAIRAFASALADEHELPISQRTKVRIKAAGIVKQSSYDEIESKLVEMVSALFPNISAINGFARKYVNEYFRHWKCAGDIAPTWIKSLGFEPGESSVLGRAFIRDLVLRLCYLESSERRLSNRAFDEAEMAFLRHDCPKQVYQALISERARSEKMSQEKLAEKLATHDRALRRIKAGEEAPPLKLVISLKPAPAGHRLLAGNGFVDHLLRTLGLEKSVLHNEFLSIASVFFRHHPTILKDFVGRIARQTESGEVRHEACDFEKYIGYGDHLLLHPGFEGLYPEMPDAMWRCHLYTLQFARIVDLAQAYYQFAKEDSDAPLEKFLREAENESNGCPYRWMEKLQSHRHD